MFNYANGTEAEKAWVDGITNVALVAADERNNTLNEKLDYTLDKAYPHNGGTVACIQVPLGQSNFFSTAAISCGSPPRERASSSPSTW